MSSVPDHWENTLHRGHNSTRTTTALHVQLVTELYLYRLHLFNKIEVSRLDSTLSVFIIIFVLHTLSWCQISGKIVPEILQ